MAQIQRFYVVPTCWGKGVAQLLMATALEYFAAAGHRNVSVWTGTHPRARRFYEKSGFTLSGRERPYPFIDDFVLTEY